MKTIIRPGVLVALKSTVTGGVRYQRTDLPLEGEYPVRDGSIRRWETIKTVSDPAEHEAATKARNKALSLVRAVCAETVFGLLCPKDKEADLEAALAEARAVAQVHNQSAKYTTIGLYVLRAQIVDSDAEAAKAIAAEVSDALSKLTQAVQACDVKQARMVRDSLSEVSAMLADTPLAAVRIVLESTTNWARKYSAWDRRGRLEGEPKPELTARALLDFIETAQVELWDQTEV